MYPKTFVQARFRIGNKNNDIIKDIYFFKKIAPSYYKFDILLHLKFLSNYSIIQKLIDMKKLLDLFFQQFFFAYFFSSPIKE